MRSLLAAAMAAAVLVFGLAYGAQAQTADRGKTIIVLDGSGSMWGQVEGEAKITIARRALADLLVTLPPEQELGLVAYGHRRKGDCGDIEILVQPGPGTRDAIAAAVEGVSPKGKTPLSDAVIAAAQELRYVEDRATVVLLSDGIETCDMDPCAVGAELEASGVDFTAHVIGFDVAAESDREQLRCLAENTGGVFVSAGNEEELAEALQTVSQPPMPVILPVTFQASEGEGGPILTEDLIWSVTDIENGETLVVNEAVAGVSLELPEGRYGAEVLRTTDEAYATGEVEVTGTQPIVVTLVLPEFVPQASLDAPPTAPAGSTVEVGWSGPDEQNDYITVAEVGAQPTGYLNYTYVRTGNPVELEMPEEPGTYELRYIQNSQGRVLATRSIEVTEIEATITAAPTAAAGEELPVEWTGPDYQNDFITVSKVGDDDGKYENYTYTREGSPLMLLMPAEPGSYEIRYVLNQGRRVLARHSVEVTDIGATVSAPPSAAAGSLVSVEWEGPDYKNDYISVAEPGDPDNKYVNYSYTRKGSPLELLLPTEPGTYEIRYVLNQDTRILARQSIEVTDVAATLAAPPSAPAGSDVSVEWEGPDYKNDYISVAEPGQPDSKYLNYTYTRSGSPLTLTMPVEPGSYELRYVVNQDSKVLARLPIEITGVTASITTPPTANAGSELMVEWTGPDYKNDFISVAMADQPGHKYENYTYTREGSPLALTMPVEPGDYEIRYIVNQGKEILVSQPIVVTEVGASIMAPPSATAGEELMVEWTGPDYKNDFISVASADQPGHKYENYTYTREGSPLALTMPPQPGDYEIRYIVNQGKEILASQPIQVGAVEGSVEAPPTAVAGATIAVQWEGPDYKNDLITVAVPDQPAHKYVNYTYSRSGSPLSLVMPPEPGTYEIRYVLNQDKTILASTTIEVTEVTASLNAPPSGAAGGTLQVEWEGPDYKNDLVTIASPDQPAHKYADYAYVRSGSPVTLDLPDAPGNYELRYVMDQGKRILASVPFTVE